MGFVAAVVGAVAALGLGVVGDLDGLAADGCGGVVTGVGVGGAEEEDGVAVADDGFPAVAVELLALADVLDDGVE